MMEEGIFSKKSSGRLSSISSTIKKKLEKIFIRELVTMRI